MTDAAKACLREITRHELEEQRRTLIAYLRVKLVQNDWHGVSDAANDLRVLEEQMRHE